MSLDRRLRALCASALTGLMLAALPAAARAQTTSASVTGTVQDSQGGALPGVAVMLTSRTQGNTRHRHDGRRRALRVRDRPPDTYTLTAELQGFKKLERTNLVVNANDRLSAGILALEVGAMTEEVTVSTRVSELQTTSGERSFTLENSALQNIANNGRAMFNFATLVPGVVPNANGGGELGQVSAFTVNGQRANSNTMSIDGVANIDTGDNGGNMATTNIDAVAEFKVLTNAYQAEYGRAVGAQLQVVTKSGSRDFHGSGYWYGRRSDWNANSWTNNRTTRRSPQPSATTPATRSAARSGRQASTRARRSCSSSSARSTSAASRPAARTRRACRRISSAAATSRRASTARATRSPTSVTTLPACRAARATPAAASRTAACSDAFRRVGSTRPASRP